MERLEYNIEIAAPAKQVWETMLQKETYEQWVAKSWPDSTYKGEWKKGSEIRFTGDGESGTLAVLEEVKPYEYVLAKHIALINDDGSIDKTSEQAKNWYGITEEYRFTEKNGKTTVHVTILTPPEWKAMFDDGWPIALEELKKLAERQLSEV